MTISDPAESGRRDLDRKLLGGVAWSSLARFATQAMSWIVTLHVARILSPTDYGIISAAMIYLGLVRLITEFGLGTIIVTKSDLSSNVVAQIGGSGVLMGVFFSILTVVLAQPISLLVKAPAVADALPLFALTSLIATVSIVPMALLQKKLAFKTLSAIELVRSLAASLGLLILAHLGFRFWSIALSELISALVGAVALTSRMPFRIAIPRIVDMRPLFSMSRELLLGRLAWYGYTNADFFVASRRLGTRALGEYTMGWTLITFPTDRIASLVLSVTPPVLARVKNNPAELVRYFVLLTEGLSIVLFPLCIGLALVADDVVRIFLGSKWAGAVGVMQALAIFSTLRSAMPLVSQMLTVRGRTREGMWFSIASFVLLVPAFWIGSSWGTAGIAWAWAALYPPLALWQYTILAKALDMRLRHIFAAYIPAAAGCAIMSAVVLMTQSLADQQSWTASVRLLVATTSGAAAYCTWIALARGARVKSILQLVRKTRPAVTPPTVHAAPPLAVADQAIFDSIDELYGVPAEKSACECTVIIGTMAAENRQSSLLRAIDSIVASTRKQVEVVVVVNGNRAHAPLLALLRERAGVRVLLQAEGSLPKAMHRGRVAVRTPYFAFLDDDDEYLIGGLDVRLEALQARPDASLVTSNGYKRRHGREALMLRNLSNVAADPLGAFLLENWLPSCGALYRTSRVSAEYFADIQKYFEWTQLAFRLVSNGHVVAVVDEPTFRIHESEVSESKSTEYLEAHPAILEDLLRLVTREDLAQTLSFRRA
ncbi:MAG: oligosaccharide flippase family protein, partial [Planctomycetaceae bacterium]|nr:oligosaccharide flippase family protein [Planctomycetaceae bacterium]